MARRTRYQKLKRFFRNIRLRYQSWRYGRWVRKYAPELIQEAQEISQFELDYVMSDLESEFDPSEGT